MVVCDISSINFFDALTLQASARTPRISRKSRTGVSDKSQRPSTAPTAGARLRRQGKDAGAKEPSPPRHITVPHVSAVSVDDASWVWLKSLACLPVLYIQLDMVKRFIMF